MLLAMRKLRAFGTRLAIFELIESDKCLNNLKLLTLYLYEQKVDG